MPRLTVTRIGAVVAAFGLGARYIGDFLSMAQPSLPNVPLDVTASILKPAVTKVIITEIMSSTGSPSVEDAIAAQHLLQTLLSNVTSHIHQPNILDATHYDGIPLGFPYGSPVLDQPNVADDMNYTGIPLSFPNATNSTFTVPLPSNNTRNDILNITALPSSASCQAVGWLGLGSATLNNFAVTLLQKSQEASDTQHNAAIALLALFSFLVACLTPSSRHWATKNKSLLASTALGMMSGHYWSLLSVLIACPNILVQLLHSLLAGTPNQVRLATKIIDATHDITVNIMRLIGHIVEYFRAAAFHWKLAVEYSDLTVELRKNNDTLARENEDLKAELEKLNRKFDTLQRHNNPVAEDNEARTNKVEELDRMGGAFLEDNHALTEEDEILKTRVGEVKRTGEATPKILELRCQ